jgi:hypothetical protein
MGKVDIDTSNDTTNSERKALNRNTDVSRIIRTIAIKITDNPKAKLIIKILCS